MLTPLIRRESDDRFRVVSNILFVCTANICRSAAAEAIARERYGDSGHRFASAGFLYDGREATPEMVRALQAIGVDASAHRSRIFDPTEMASADLILTMESKHVQDIGVMSDEVFSRTLPLTEAAQRLDGRRMPTGSLVSELENRDPMVYFDSRWDVEDPYKRSKRKYRKAVQQISSLVDSVVGSLA